MPLVPSALFLWAINFVDRLFVGHYKGISEVGVYSLAVRTSSVIVFLMIAFRLAWPAFAYSIEDESDGEADIRVRPHLPALRLLLDVARARRARAVAREDPRAVEPRLLPRRRGRRRCSRSPRARTPGYTVLAIGIGRARRTQFNWIVSGIAAVVNIALNFALIPPYGMMGAAVATARRLRRAVRRDDDQRAARLPGAVPVAPRADAEQRRDRADRHRLRCPARSCSRSRSASSTRCCCCRSASTCRRSARASGASCRSAARGGRRRRGGGRACRCRRQLRARAQDHRARAEAPGHHCRRCCRRRVGTRSSRRRRVTSGPFVASLLDFGPLPERAALRGGTPLPTWFGTLLLP